ncbi:MAG: MGH1-like glycoside hydrolase domain-containing protein [Planctomycetota bacterium]|jgi:hypothetical protein
MTPELPTLSIDSERDGLLAPYRHVAETLGDSFVRPSDDNGLIATGVKGVDETVLDAWDAAFATIGMRWSRLGQFSVTDPFFAVGNDDGFIPSQLSTKDGQPTTPERKNEQFAAPLFALSEWELFKVRGDKERLGHTFELLLVDFHYREENLRKPNGLMPGAPEPYRLKSTGRFMLGGRVVPSLANSASWIDASAMYAMNVRVLSEMARLLDRRDVASELDWTFRDIASKINARCWSESERCYLDLDEHGTPIPAHTLAGAWAVWSGVAPRNRIHDCIREFVDPTRFERAHPFSTVAASEDSYRKRDGVPVGVSRGDFNLPVYESLVANGKARNAHRCCERHLRRLGRVLEQSGDLYLAYDPDQDKPAPLPDGHSGANLPLASAMVVNETLSFLFGVRPNAAKNELELNLQNPEKHSIEGLMFNLGTLNIDVGPEDENGARREIELMSDIEFKLKVRVGEQAIAHDIKPGMHTVSA